jgi:deazaflavin-dependent oxidoreductase (nitroreductase family)
MSNWNAALIEEFRASGGQVNGRFAGEPLLLLNTTGARSGLLRTNPLLYSTVGQDYAIIASKGGAPSHPDWYYNLVADPEATVEIGRQTIPVNAREVNGDERDALFAAQAVRFPFFNDYQAGVERTIPVFVLTRQDS